MRSSSCVIDVRRVHQTPLIIDVERIEQPGRGPAAAPVQTVFHFFQLLGEMDVHGAIAGQTNHRRELRPACSALRLCGATPTTASSSGETACRLRSTVTRSRRYRVTNRAWRGSGADAPEAGMGVKHWQERQADPDRLRSRGDAVGHFGGVIENGRPPRSWWR